jgi:hypothetical protein
VECTVILCLDCFVFGGILCQKRFWLGKHFRFEQLNSLVYPVAHFVMDISEGRISIYCLCILAFSAFLTHFSIFDSSHINHTFDVIFIIFCLLVDAFWFLVYPFLCRLILLNKP